MAEEKDKKEVSGEEKEEQEPERYDYTSEEKEEIIVPDKIIEKSEKKDWKDVVKPEKKKKSRVWIYAILVIIVFGAGFIYVNPEFTGLFAAASTGAAEGDTVSVYYTGSLEDGTVFDTNVESVAAEAGIERPFFEPLEFTLGARQLIPGFENAVLGMNVGEKTTVTIPPEDAYGLPDPSLMFKIPRVQEIPREENFPMMTEIPADQFLAAFGLKEKGETFLIQNLEYIVLDVTDTLVISQALVEPGQIIQFTDWESTVIAVNEEEFTVRHDPEEGKIDTPLGTANVELTEDSIIITANPVVGEKITTAFGTATVSSVDDVNFTLDTNSELAGKTLIFEIEVVEIVVPRAASPA